MKNLRQISQVNLSYLNTKEFEQERTFPNERAHQNMRLKQTFWR